MLAEIKHFNDFMDKLQIRFRHLIGYGAAALADVAPEIIIRFSHQDVHDLFAQDVHPNIPSRGIAHGLYQRRVRACGAHRLTKLFIVFGKVYLPSAAAVHGFDDNRQGRGDSLIPLNTVSIAGTRPLII